MLRRWPLPLPASDGDKEGRGRTLIIGGSSELLGAVVLAAEAALRAGAGKLTVATGRSVAHFAALALPEARVIALSETRSGGFSPPPTDALGVEDEYDSVLIGPGMQDDAATRRFALVLLKRLAGTPVVLDARALTAVCDPARDTFRFEGPVVLTPHAGEMAKICGASRDAVERAPAAAAQRMAYRLNAVVVLKGAITVIACPDGRSWQHEEPNVGLAVSGSGDVLAGLITGLVARGAALEQAAAWGVVLHARAGRRLARRLGPLGYLARELAAEAPALMASLRR